MRLKSFICAVSLLALGSVAQAADFRLGGQLSGVSFVGNGFAGEAGVHFSMQGPIGDFHLRQVVEGGALFASGQSGAQAIPMLRLDTDLLKYNGALYFGAGVGSGFVLLPGTASPSTPEAGFGTLISPLLLNIHGIIGQDFGSYSVEGVVRLGAVSGVGVRVSFPLR